MQSQSILVSHGNARKNPALSLLTLLCMLAMASMASAQVYVSTSTGADTNDGSIGSPVATIAQGLSLIGSPPVTYAITADGEQIIDNSIAWAATGSVTGTTSGMTALLIVDAPGSMMDPADYMQSRLEAAGMTVTALAPDDVTIAIANTYSLIVIDESIGSSDVNGLADPTLTVPVITCEAYSWHKDWAYQSSDYTSKNVADSTDISVLAASDVLLTGVSGTTIPVYSPAYTINSSDGTYDADIIQVAAAATDTSQICVWRAEAGTLDSNAGRTVGLFLFGSEAGFGIPPAGWTATLNIAEGTYAENELSAPGVSMLGGWNDVFDTNSSTAANTIIDGTESGRILGLGGDQLIQQITFTNGVSSTTSPGGAFYQTQSSGALEIIDCVITGCYGTDAGDTSCLMFIDSGADTVALTDCLFNANGSATADNNGWALRINDGDAVITMTGCTFSNNTVGRRLIGGYNGADWTFTDCVIDTNTASTSLFWERQGDGAYIFDSCDFLDNTVNYMFRLDNVRDSDGLMTWDSCVIDGNDIRQIYRGTWDAEAGDGTDTFDLTMKNCVVSNNTTQNPGMSLQGHSITVINNTFYGNAGTGGSLVQIEATATVETNAGEADAMEDGSCNNNIFMRNIGYSTGMIASGGNTVTWGEVKNNLFYENDNSNPMDAYGPYAGYTDNQTTAITLPGRLSGVANFEDDPLFVDAANGDFHLTNTETSRSPAVDAGLNSGQVSTDFEDDPRPTGERADIGADETDYEVPADNAVRNWTVFE